MFKYFIVVIVLIYPFLAPACYAASFDCALNLNKVERMICDSSEVSLLDEQLSVIYNEVKNSLDDKAWLVKQQRAWIKITRNRCPNAKCLARIYRARMDELKAIATKHVIEKQKQSNTSAKIPNFYIKKGAGRPLCEDYLKIINGLPLSDIKACELPSLMGSPFTPVVFKPLTGDKLKATDRIVYEQIGRPRDDWEAQWPQRKKEYDMDYRRLGEAFWDLDKDGKADRIVQKSLPDSWCTIHGKGDAFTLTKKNRALWKSLSIEEQIEQGERYGYKTAYSLIRDGKLSSVSAGTANFVMYEGQYIYIGHSGIQNRDTTNDWASRNWGYIAGVNPIRRDKSRLYGTTLEMCLYSVVD